MAIGSTGGTDSKQTIYFSVQTDNHSSTSSIITQFFQAGCSPWRPANSVKALNYRMYWNYLQRTPEIDKLQDGVGGHLSNTSTATVIDLQLRQTNGSWYFYGQSDKVHISHSRGLQKEKNVADNLTAAKMQLAVSWQRVDTTIVSITKSPYNLTGLQ